MVRLKDALSKGMPFVTEMSEKQLQNRAGDHFSPGAHWEELPLDGDFEYGCSTLSGETKW